VTEVANSHEVQFPLSISFGATGGPERRNEIVELTSGRERRNARFAHSRHRYDAGTGVRSIRDLQDLIAFFEARRGSLHGFRFRDPFDMKSCRPEEEPTPLDQQIGVGDGTNRRFPLTKIYGSGEDAYARPILRPVVATLRVAIDGVEKAKPVDFDFDAATGEVVFAEASVPGADLIVTAGYEFDVPVRFDTDRLTVSLSTFNAGQVPSIPLVEVRP
jgi:uncharacterized protein (TIGR02217 family)